MQQGVEPEQAFWEACAKVAIERAAHLTVKAWSVFRKHLELPGDRQDILIEVLFGNGDHYLHAANRYSPRLWQTPLPPAGASGFPHDARALEAIIQTIPGSVNTIADMIEVRRLGPGDHLITTGSPKANALVSGYLPMLVVTHDSQQYHCETKLAPHLFPYVLVEDLTKPPVWVTSLARGGVRDAKSRKAIRHSIRGGPENWTPRGYLEAKDLAADFLLVSRLPRGDAGGSILSIAGAHGAATEAIRFLVDGLPISELRDLESAIRGRAYYQFVIEVTEVEHREGVGTFPIAAKICTELPPVRLYL